MQDKIAIEISEFISDPNRPIKMEDLRDMRYLENCIKESLRMYPPVHLISRRLTEDVTLSKSSQKYYDLSEGIIKQFGVTPRVKKFD